MYICISAAAASWHEQLVSSNHGHSQFWGPPVPKNYDTRLIGEILFVPCTPSSDFRWCHAELLLGMHGAADAFIAAWYCR